jgi:murein DD-endopeptidase MepM/ murein hydrolase activator NlpD
VAGAAIALLVGVAVLCVPPARAAEHVVRPGENLTAIARRYGVSVDALVQLNGVDDPNHVLAGTRLRVPGSGSTSTASSKGSARTASSSGATVEQPLSFTISDSQRRRTARLLEQAAVEFGVSPSLLKALTYTESRWRQDVVSATGAVGVGQLLPGTAEWIATVMGEPDLDVASRGDNIRMSARLLRLLLDVTGSTKRALAAYYQGIGSVLRTGTSSGGAAYASVIRARQAWFA